MYSPEEEKEILRICAQYRLLPTAQHRYILFEGDIPRVIYVLVEVRFFYDRG